MNQSISNNPSYWNGESFSPKPNLIRPYKWKPKVNMPEYAMKWRPYVMGRGVRCYEELHRPAMKSNSWWLQPTNFSKICSSNWIFLASEVEVVALVEVTTSWNPKGFGVDIFNNKKNMSWVATGTTKKSDVYLFEKGGMSWNYPPTRNSDHQDSSVFSRESL